MLSLVCVLSSQSASCRKCSKIFSLNPHRLAKNRCPTRRTCYHTHFIHYRYRVVLILRELRVLRIRCFEGIQECTAQKGTIHFRHKKAHRPIKSHLFQKTNQQNPQKLPTSKNALQPVSYIQKLCLRSNSIGSTLIPKWWTTATSNRTYQCKTEGSN